MNRLSRLLVTATLVAGACSSGNADARSGRRAGERSSTTAAATPETTATTAAPAPVPSTTAPPSSTTAPPAPPPPPTPTTAALPPPAPGTLAWRACGGLECATLTVPRDYSNPGGPGIDIALARKRATNAAARIGSLVFNPGGPGNSGVDALPGELNALTAALKARFDVVSFDPRGVGRTFPVRCRPPGSSPSSGGGGAPLDPAPATPEGQRALTDGYRAYAEACTRHSPDQVSRVGTDSTVEDLERIRIALGDERLTFIGHSAGTFLGAIYAERYPHRVRGLVLDGAIDPSLSLDGMTLAQAVSFERSLHEFFAWCTSTGCAWRPAGDRPTAFLDLMDRVRQQPLQASGGEVVGIDKLINGTMSRLTSRSRWASLGEALAAAEQGDGNPLATLASGYKNSGASNAADARHAITCLDHPAPRDPNVYPGLADAWRAQAPVFGPVFAWSVLSCGVWTSPATLPAKPVRGAGAPPVLVIGTTGDPATPRAWAESLANQLEQGVLVVRQGEEHVAYYYSACVRAIVDTYLIDGRPPADGTTCSR